MAKTTSDKPSASADKTLKRQKKQARREAKLMLEIEAANKDLKRAQKKQSKAQACLEEQSAYVHTLETRLEELRAPSLVSAIEMPPDSAELERQQEPSELESSIAHSDGNQQASPEAEASTFTSVEPHTPVAEETTHSEAKVVTNEVTEGSEVTVVQDNETAIEPAPTPATPRKAPAQKTVATRKPAVTKRPTSSSTATKRPTSSSTVTKRPASSSTVTKRPANRSQSTRQPHADAE
jgi:hypothetical protein